jgi:hypothetical protein
MASLKVKKDAPLTVTGGVKLKSRKPSFGSLMGEHPAEVADNPLDSLVYPDDPEQAATVEISEALAFIKAERQKKRDAYRVTVDPEYWVCLCFQSREQKEEFLARAGWLDLGEKYLDGLEVAKRLGVAVLPIPLEAKAPPLAPKSLRKEVDDNA